MRLPFDSLKQSVASHPPTKSLWGGGGGSKKGKEQGETGGKKGKLK